MKPKISVIMSVYNCEDTVSEAIESILAQTFQDFEFIICDDCSTDKTYDIVFSYHQQYPDKVVVLRNGKNSKLAYSLNHCLLYAKGKYIARMDGDDISMPERLEKQLNFLEKHPEYDVVGSSMIFFDQHGDRTVLRKKENPGKYDLIKNPCFHHATILMKKNVYDDLGGYTVLPRTARGQDYDLWFRFFAKGYIGYNLPEALYKVRVGVQDLKRRTFKTRLQAVQTAFYGYKLLHFPIRYYIYALKPLAAGIVPSWIMFSYQKKIQTKLTNHGEN